MNQLVFDRGMKDQPNKLRNRVSTGANTKPKVLALVGTTVSFNNSFRPSAKG
jgi:ribosomal protein L31E